MSANSELDITSSEGLSELTRTLRSAGINLALAEVRQPVIAATRRTGLLATIGEDHLYLTIDEAVVGLDAHRSDRERG
jgi:STAS domain-containing protein